jgi:hypothetical protein
MYKILINDILYSVKSGCITGEEIRKLGNIPENHELKFRIPGRMELIEVNNEDHIDLTRPGIEYFIAIEKI